MNQFKKLALASAVAALPMSGMAMEALEDEAMAAVTGQDGITVSIASTSIAALRIDDSDAFAGSSVATGAIFISGMSITGATDIVIDADQDTIQAAVSLAAGTIDLGVVSAVTLGGTAGGSTLLDMGSITHGGITITAQLGVEDQGNMIELSGTVTGGLSITGFSITDQDSLGSISMDLTVTDTGGTDLTLAGDINATATGLTIAGVSGTGLDIELGSLTLGGGSAIGDVSIIDLDLGTITISGH